MDALMPLGMVSDFPSENQTMTTSTGTEEETKDYFVERDGEKFAYLTCTWADNQHDLVETILYLGSPTDRTTSVLHRDQQPVRP